MVQADPRLLMVLVAGGVVASSRAHACLTFGVISCLTMLRADGCSEGDKAMCVIDAEAMDALDPEARGGGVPGTAMGAVEHATMSSGEGGKALGVAGNMAAISPTGAWAGGGRGGAAGRELTWAN
jgi:hypothetical protein